MPSLRQPCMAPAAPEPYTPCCCPQVRFYQVSEEELEAAREGFQNGSYQIRIEQSQFDMASYTAMLESIKDEVAALKERQKAAMAVQLQLEAESLVRIKEAQEAAGISGPAPMEEDGEDESAFEVEGNELVGGRVFRLEVHMAGCVLAGCSVRAL